jgi:hypothetical protein
MSAATCEKRATQPDSPGRSRPPGCADISPFRRCSSITDRCGYSHSSRLGKTKNRQQRGMAEYFNRLLGQPVAQDCRNILNCDAFLFHRIAIAQRHCVVQRGILLSGRFKINCHSNAQTFSIARVPASLSFLRFSYVVSQALEKLSFQLARSPKSVPTVRCSAGGSSELTKFRNRSEKTSGRSFQY